MVTVKFFKLITIVLISGMSLTVHSVYAQFKIDVFSGIAVNPIDRPCMISAGFSPGYVYKNFAIDYALDINLNHRDKKVLNAFATSLSYKLNLCSNPLKFSLFYCNKPVSQMLNIHNTGLKINYIVKRWDFTLGNNFNIYKFTNNVAETYNIADNRYLVESPNIMYSVKYFIMQPGNVWNLYINISNFEIFIVEQEINPMFNVGFIWKKNSNWPQFFIDHWYQTAGLNNIRVNYFGWFTRIGVHWEIN